MNYTYIENSFRREDGIHRYLMNKIIHLLAGKNNYLGKYQHLKWNLYYWLTTMEVPQSSLNFKTMTWCSIQSSLSWYIRKVSETAIKNSKGKIIHCSYSNIWGIKWKWIWWKTAYFTMGLRADGKWILNYMQSVYKIVTEKIQHIKPLNSQFPFPEYY